MCYILIHFITWCIHTIFSMIIWCINNSEVIEIINMQGLYKLLYNMCHNSNE